MRKERKHHTAEEQVATLPSNIAQPHFRAVMNSRIRSICLERLIRRRL